MNYWEEIKFIFTYYFSVAIFSSFFTQFIWNSDSQLDLLPGKRTAYFLFHCRDSELPWFRQYIHRTHWHVLPVENYHTQEIFWRHCKVQNKRSNHLWNNFDLIKGSRSIACCIKPEKSTVHPHHHHHYAIAIVPDIKCDLCSCLFQLFRSKISPSRSPSPIKSFQSSCLRHRTWHQG